MDFKSLRTKSSLAVIITAAVLVEITSGIQCYFAQEGIRQEVEHRADRVVSIAKFSSPSINWSQRAFIKRLASMAILSGERANGSFRTP
nr:hypothetical protein [Paludibacteraceae bacterium]